MRMVQTLLPTLLLTLFGTFHRYGKVHAKVHQASLRADSKEIPAGGSVTLTCSVNMSTDWRYYWFKRTPEFSKPFIIKNGTIEQDMSISEEGIYYCRGGKGDPVFFTEDSNTVTIDKTETPVKRAVILHKDTWSNMFIGERISLACVASDGGGTEWEYEWKTTSSETPPKSTEQWVFNTSISTAGDYFCRGKQKMTLYPPTMWSYPIRLTVLSGKPEATLSVGLFPWDEKWTLTCLATKSRSTWKYFWYRGEERSEFLPTQGLAFRNEIHVSQTGLYWCRGGRGVPVYYTEFSEPLKVGTKEESDSLTTEAHFSRITGLACGSLLISLLLLLICLLREIRALPSCFIQSVNSNQASAAQETICQDPYDPYMTLRPGNFDIYESIHTNRTSDIGKATDDGCETMYCDQLNGQYTSGPE